MELSDKEVAEVFAELRIRVTRYFVSPQPREPVVRLQGGSSFIRENRLIRVDDEGTEVEHFGAVLLGALSSVFVVRMPDQKETTSIPNKQKTRGKRTTFRSVEK